jgi:hypothetical protein
MYSEFKKLKLLNILWQLFWVFENNVFRVQKAEAWQLFWVFENNVFRVQKTEAIKYFLAIISLCLFFPTLVRASLKYVVPVFHSQISIGHRITCNGF